jgi:hypothetical protein
MYQVEVKRTLVERLFPPSERWAVVVHLDPMELAQGGTHTPGKAEVAQRCLQWFSANHVSVEVDAEYGKADLVARHPDRGTFVIEVEAESRRIRTQAFYSALGQTLVRKYGEMPSAKYGIAVPASDEWKALLGRVPRRLFQDLEIEVFLVSSKDVTNLYDVISSSEETFDE